MTERGLSEIGAGALVLLLAVALVATTGRAEATFPGENGRIVFASERDGNFDLYTMSSDGDGVRRLTDTKGRVEHHDPAWSPDGGKVAFVKCETYYAGCDLWSMRADGSGKKRLSKTDRNAFRYEEFVPTWSPDGTRIAYQRDGQVWVMKADGSDPQKIARGYSQFAPDWSPRLPGGGSRLAFSGNDRPCYYIICTTTPEGEDPVALTTTSGPEGYAPSWSPDATQIAFYSRTFDIPNSIFAANADGTDEARRLTAPPDDAYDRDPAWSPDGTEVVFSRSASARAPGELWKINADGTGERRLTTNRTEDVEPDWQPSR